MNMSIRKIASSAALMAGLAAMNLVTLGSAAQAYDGRGPSRGDRGHWHKYSQPRHDYRDHRRHDRRDKNVARGIAIGVGALVIGSILAAEANRRDRDDRYDRY